MADVELKEYCTQIEEMLAAENNDEAIAHCRHILNYYPKNLVVYRLLGKAFLEKRRFSDASDIFYRLLSSAPDDFVAHVGLGIIGEEEGDLARALGHMERAFEAQPSNAAIQAELGRLYGRRDGVEPTRVRLTRGALARLYVRGGNYARAAAELREALEVDADRIDLQVVLATALWKDEQRIDAVDICQDVLQKLPFCLDANAILYEIWTSSGRGDESQEYWQRIEAMDPYLASTLSGRPSKLKTPQVPQLDYIPPTPDELMGVPEWVHDLGLSYDESDSDSLESVPPFFADDQVELPEGESLLLADSGQGPESVPDWLRDLVPSEDMDADNLAGEESFDWGDGAETEAEEPAPDWLQEAGLLDEPTDQEDQVGESADQGGSLPDWLTQAVDWSSEEDDRAAGVDEQEEPEGTLAPDAFEEELEPAPANSEFLLPDDEADDVSDTLGSSAADKVGVDFPPAVSTEDDVPFDWLEETDEAVEESPAEMPAGEEELTGAGDLQEVAAGDHKEESVMSYSDEEWNISEDDEAWGDVPSEPDDALDWLEQLAAKQDASEEAPAAGQQMPESAEPAEEIPDWLKELAPPDVKETQPEPADLPADQTPDDLPDWLQPASEDLEAADTLVPGSEEVEFESELPEWLRDLETEPSPSDEDPDAPTGPIGQRTGPDAELPEWLSGEMAEDEVSELHDELASVGVELEDIPADPDDAMAWLDELASQQEESRSDLASFFERADEAEAAAGEVPAQESADDELPDWLRTEETVIAPAPVAQADTEEDELGEMPEDVDEAMAWLERLAAQQGAPVEELPTVADSEDLDLELPPWLAAEVEAETDETPAAAEAPADEEESEFPAWLEEAPAMPEAEDKAPELPEWLLGEEEEHVEPEPEADAAGEFEPMEEAEMDLPAWLRDDATAGEEAELPAWLQEAAVEETSPAIELEPAAEEEPSEPELEPIAEEAHPVAEPEPVDEPISEQEELIEEEMELPAWLQEAEMEPAGESAPQVDPVAETVIEEPVALEAEVEAPAGEATEEPVTWDEVEEEATPVVVTKAEVEEVEAEPEPMADLEEPEIEEIGEAAMAEAAGLDEPELPEWLRDEVVEPAETEVEVDTGELTRMAELDEPELPPWLQEELDEPELATEEDEESPAEETEAEEEAEPMAELLEGVAGYRAQLAKDPANHETRLALARALVSEQSMEESLAEYTELVSAGQELDDVVADLSTILQSEPGRLPAWQLLGDAYMKQGELQQALDAYRQALDQL